MFRNGTDSLQLQVEESKGMDVKQKWEIIAKYHGDILKIENELDAVIEVLNYEYAIITLPLSQVNSLLNYNEIEYLELPRKISMMDTRAVCGNNLTDRNNTHLTGKGVIIGVIDSGIDYTHKDFRNEDGTTRIHFIWDQSVEGTPPDGFYQGNVYTQSDINFALENNQPLKHKDNVGHGTAVAGVAAGNGLASDGEHMGIAPEAILIIVKLGSTGQAKSAKTTEFMRGIKFIFDMAQMEEKPVCINASFGTNDGSHDGLSLFETYIDSMEEMYKSSIIVATGNEGDTGHHYQNIVMDDEIVNIQYTIIQSLSTCYLSLWKSFIDDMDFEIIAPSGESTGIINKQQSITKYTLDNMNISFLYGTPTPYNGEQEIYIQMDKNYQLNAGATWTLRVSGRSIVDGRFDVWLPVNEAVSLETSFLKPSLSTTLTIPSTSTSVISVGGYNSMLDSIATFSGRGFTRLERTKPDIIAPSVDITSTSVGGGYDTFSGTSFAAPHVTGAAAVLMEWGIILNNDPYMYGQRLKAYLRKGAKRISMDVYPNRESGYGRLCISNTLNFLMTERVLAETDAAAVPVIAMVTADGTPNENDFMINEKSFTQSENPNTSEYFVEFIANNDQFTRTLLSKIGGIYYNIDDFVNFIIISVPVANYEDFMLQVGGNSIGECSFLLGLCSIDSIAAAGILAVQNQTYLDLTGLGVLVCVIDTGIDYTNPSFIYDDGTTKIKYIWDQTEEGSDTIFGYGTEYNESQINKALRDNSREVVKEVDTVGHGTFLASIMSGRKVGQNIGAAPESSIICVKLKEAKSYLKNIQAIQETDMPVFQSSDIMRAINYVFKKGLELKMPVAICLGMGTNQSAHDGNSLFEQYITSVGNSQGVFIGIAAGNECSRKHHTDGKINKTGDKEKIEVKIDSQERGVVVSIYNYQIDKISISIKTPLGEVIERIPSKNNTIYSTGLVLEQSTITVIYGYSSPENSNQTTSIKIADPTPGVWEITLYGDNIINGRFHSWLPISQFVKSGTYFLQPTPSYTVTVPSTAHKIVCVGAYYDNTGGIYVDSGRGPSKNMLLKPALIAPGVNVGGEFPYGYGTMTGTSVAAAHVVGAAALMLEWGIVQRRDPIMNTITIYSYLAKGAIRKNNDSYPNNISGYGHLNLMNTFDNM